MQSRVKSYRAADGRFNTDMELTEFESREKALWRAVVLQALHDAALSDPPTSITNHEQWNVLRVRREARNWFGTRDFNTVCDMASLSPSEVLTRVPR